MCILFITWWIAWGILLGYYLIIFRARPQTPILHEDLPLPGVSIVIAVKNGSHDVGQNLPFILDQDYPRFEVVVVDDHSDATEGQKLHAMAEGNPLMSVITSEGPPGKKNALLAGIERASYDWILCTDADCRPMTKDWILTMINNSREAGMVLGYSPYDKEKGLLNLFVCFETMMTGIQYLSWARLGRPYMGVGRNLMYSKQLFNQIQPYRHDNLPYGDDDLWVQQAAKRINVNVALDPKAHMVSVPPRTWLSWWKQKHRHLSAAHEYSRSAWWQPGLHGISLILHWSIFLVLVFGDPHAGILLACLTGLIVRWWIYTRWARVLQETQTRPLYPILEILYALYLAIMGWTAIVVKKKSWN